MKNFIILRNVAVAAVLCLLAVAFFYGGCGGSDILNCTIEDIATDSSDCNDSADDIEFGEPDSDCVGEFTPDTEEGGFGDCTIDCIGPVCLEFVEESPSPSPSP